MNFKDYQELAARTAKTSNSFKDQLLEYSLGVCGETGEISDTTKKMIYHGHYINPEDLKKEIGDVLWYLANLARILDTDLETIAEMNIQKLMKRYPNGFSSEDSIKRVDVNEGA